MTKFHTENGADPTNPPAMLIIPGIDNSGPSHWQSLWEAENDDAFRVNMENWAQPHRNSWVTRLNLAVRSTDRPIILVAHSLGCHAVAWWAALAEAEASHNIVGALLVAPPEVDAFPADHRLASFGPTPKAILPFRSILVASRNDPYVQFDRARQLAGFWGSEFVDAGFLGHINAATDIGLWRDGQQLVSRLQYGVPASLGPSPAVRPATPIAAADAQHWPSTYGVNDHGIEAAP